MTRIAGRGHHVAPHRPKRVSRGPSFPRNRGGSSQDHHVGYFRSSVSVRLGQSTPSRRSDASADPSSHSEICQLSL